jgi:hypothetical protein
MAPNDHSGLIRTAAKAALSPLGFQQKGRSRVWFADRGLWMLLVEFQPSGFGKGSYLNIGASWLWYSDSDWQFDYFRRASGLVPFEPWNNFGRRLKGSPSLLRTKQHNLTKNFTP